MSELSRALAEVREETIEKLCLAGFRLHDECTLYGEIAVAGVGVEHEVFIPAGYPIDMPKVSTPGGEGPLTWHRNSDCSFCLWSSEGTGDLPWIGAAAILARVDEWYAAAAAGWPDDKPMLDLERYWPRVSGLVLHGDLDNLLGKKCKIRRISAEPELWRLEVGHAQRGKKYRRNAEIVDIGTPEHPIRTVFEILENLEGDATRRIQSGLEHGDIGALIVKYSREGNTGALALFVTGVNPLELRAAQIAHEGRSTLRMRSGFDAETLSGKRVAVVGVGSVGSHLADLLARSGIGYLTLVDGDVLRPGNCVRHLLGRDKVGMNKAEGVREHLVHEGILDRDSVSAIPNALLTAPATEELFRDHDLVVDATGDGPATTLVSMAAKILGQNMITVCVQGGGSVIRVDRLPLREGEKHSLPVTIKGFSSHNYEGGCGDPVSATPPWVCAAAASDAVALVADVLTGRDEYPQSLIRRVVTGDEISNAGKE